MPFLRTERQLHTVNPDRGRTFAALEAVAPDDVKCVIVGQAFACNRYR